MSGNRHIVHVQNMNTDVKNMLEILTHNLWIVMPSSWVCLTIYVAWYFSRVKRYSAITPTEAKQLWTIHRHDAHCNGKKWRQLKNGKQTIGFECECGFKHVQQKPIAIHTPSTMNRSEVTSFDKLHTSHKSA